MYAVVYQVDFKPDWVGDIDAELEQVVAMTKSTPGFVRGTWTTDGAKALSFIVMQDEGTARAMAASSDPPPDAGITMRSIDVYEVARDV